MALQCRHGKPHRKARLPNAPRPNARTTSTHPRTQLVREWRHVTNQYHLAEHDHSPDRSIVLSDSTRAPCGGATTPTLLGGATYEPHPLARRFDYNAAYGQFCAAIVSTAPDALATARTLIDEVAERTTAWRYGPLAVDGKGKPRNAAAAKIAADAPWVDERAGRPSTATDEIVAELRAGLSDEAGTQGVSILDLTATVGRGRCPAPLLIQMVRDASGRGYSGEAIAAALDLKPATVRHWLRKTNTKS